MPLTQLSLIDEIIITDESIVFKKQQNTLMKI